MPPKKGRPAPPPLYVSTDPNHSGADAVAGLRGHLFAAAEQEPIPQRFDATPHPDRPAMVLTDAESGRGTVVPLFAYRAVRKVLHDLFGDHPG